MARLKFLLFALVALGLWGYHLTQIAPLAVTASVEQATASVSGAAGPIAVALESQRSLTQAVALKVVTTAAAAWNAGPKTGGKPEAPTVDRVAAVRSAAQEVVPEGAKEQLFIAVVNEAGSLSVKGTGEPVATAPEGVDLNAISTAGTAGSLVTIDGASYLALSVPLAISDKNEVRAGGSVIIGLPVLFDAGVLEATAKSLHLTSLALVAGDKPVLSNGEAAATTDALAKLKGGANGTVREGPVRELGPLMLPIMVDTPSLIGGRAAITGTPFEVVATASSKGALDSLAAYQVFALGGLVGLFLLSIVFTIIMGGQTDEGGGMVLPPPMPIPPKRDDTATSGTGLKAALQPPPMEPPPEEPPPAEASPDDFHFPPSTASGLLNAPPPPPRPSSDFAPPPAAPFDEPTSDPFAQAAPPPPPPPAPTRAPPPPARQPAPPPVATSEAPAFVPSGGLMDDEDEGQRTVAYPAFKPPPGAVPPPASDPFALAAAQEESHPNNPYADNPDATRVAAVPAELIKAARAGASGNTGERPAIRPSTASMPKVAALTPAGGNEEERHFQEVFRDFVATREKCREPADGLTFDKFKLKLLKNKEQLVAKYQCRTVRFQVYVKDGKAALKATPVKD